MSLARFLTPITVNLGSGQGQAVEDIRFNDEGMIRYKVKRHYSVALWDQSTGQGSITAAKIGDDGARRIGR
jgi:hypothetical protein